MVSHQKSNQDWVLLSYQVPREPSTPRIAIWRKLKQLGVAQLGDGLVALPQNPRTLEHLEWIAQQVLESSGRAVVWAARPTLNADGADLTASLRAARSAEYEDLKIDIDRDLADASTPPTKRTIQRWRRTWRAIDKRDYFDSPGRDACRLAIDDAAQRTRQDGTEQVPA